MSMNGKTLPVPHGAPLRLRVERQLGYKMPKYVMRIELVDSFAAYRRRQAAASGKTAATSGTPGSRPSAASAGGAEDGVMHEVAAMDAEARHRAAIELEHGAHRHF